MSVTKKRPMGRQSLVQKGRWALAMMIGWLRNMAWQKVQGQGHGVRWKTAAFTMMAMGSATPIDSVKGRTVAKPSQRLHKGSPTSSKTPAHSWQDKWAYHCGLLSQFHTLQATVVQQNPRGDLQQGTLYIGRPGRMRLVYHPPCLLDLMATGNYLMLYDGQRKHTQSMSLNKTPLSFLLSGRIQDQVTVQRVLFHAPYVTWVVTWNKNPKGGTIHLTFYDVACPQVVSGKGRPKPRWTLTGWTMVDPQGNTTAVQLNQVRVDQRLPAQAFQTEKY